MSYQLLALDLDGTLIGPDLQIHPHDRTAIKQARMAGLSAPACAASTADRCSAQAGVRVTLATGRGFPSTREYARGLHLTTPVICYQGGLVKDPESGAVLHEANLPADIYTEAAELAREHDLDFTAYAGDTVYLTELRHGRAFYDRWFGLPFRQVDDLIADLDHPPIKFMIIAEEDEADVIEAMWKSHFDGRLQIVRSHPLFVEGTSLGVSKGDALARLAEHLGIAREAVIAIGDNDNDRSMIRWAGVGVAMAGAPDELKVEADYVAPAQSEAGVAHVIERFVM